LALTARGFDNLASIKIVATIEARMTSTRLPGKVLADVGGTPMLELMVDRLRRSQTVNEICVATTVNSTDDPLEEFATRTGIACYRGSEDDVLGRVLASATSRDADVIVETTGDCPFIDPAIVDACVFAYVSEDTHLVGNCLVETFPRGLDVRVFSTDALQEVSQLTNDPVDREHVSIYFYEVDGRYRVRNVEAVGDLRHPEWRWTVDTEDDLQFVRRVVELMGTSFAAIDLARSLVAHPQIVSINSAVAQKEIR
jgi:spore coat polysaccharide biosynthesis protein SpsF